MKIGHEANKKDPLLTKKQLKLDTVTHSTSPRRLAFCLKLEEALRQKVSLSLSLSLYMCLCVCISLHTCTVHVSALPWIGQHWLSWLSGYTVAKSTSVTMAPRLISQHPSQRFFQGGCHQNPTKTHHPTYFHFLFVQSLFSPLIPPPSI